MNHSIIRKYFPIIYFKGLNFCWCCAMLYYFFLQPRQQGIGTFFLYSFLLMVHSKTLSHKDISKMILSFRLQNHLDFLAYCSLLNSGYKQGNRWLFSRFIALDVQELEILQDKAILHCLMILLEILQLKWIHYTRFAQKCCMAQKILFLSNDTLKNIDLSRRIHSVMVSTLTWRS